MRESYRLESEITIYQRPFRKIFRTRVVFYDVLVSVNTLAVAVAGARHQILQKGFTILQRPFLQGVCASRIYFCRETGAILDRSFVVT